MPDLVSDWAQALKLRKHLPARCRLFLGVAAMGFSQANGNAFYPNCASPQICAGGRESPHGAAKISAWCIAWWPAFGISAKRRHEKQLEIVLEDEAKKDGEGEKEFSHVTVLLEEAVEALDIKPEGVYVDGTYGRGGHSKLILSKLGPGGKLYGFDRDPEAIASANELASSDARFVPVHSAFSEMVARLRHLGVDKVDGVLLDLGISSPQIDDPERGFSFRHDAPLDMRMDTDAPLDAATFLREAEEGEIARVIRDYSEERFARQIARAIVERRSTRPLATTLELAELVAGVVKTREKGQHPATRTFQALRIHVNDELGEVRRALPAAEGLLNEGGRLVVIAFHSLEDRIVKDFMNGESKRERLPDWAMIRDDEVPEPPMKTISKKVRADEDEVRRNPRSRSAIMRVAERTSGPLREGGREGQS